MNRLKKIRKEKGLSQQALAKEIGVSYRTLQNWENGVNTIKPDKAQALADFFGVSVGHLLGYSEESYPPFNGYIPTPREFKSWEEFDYMQLAKTDLDFYDYEKIRKHLSPLLIELILNYSFCDDDDRKIIRKIAKKFAEQDSVTFCQDSNQTEKNRLGLF